MSFERAVSYVLENEGGLSDDSEDPGGITNWGITLDVLHQMPGRAGAMEHDMRNLTRTEAVECYWVLGWKAFGLGEIGDQALATKILDVGVNVGPGQAAKIVQRACNRLGMGLLVDGWAGPKTRAAVIALAGSQAGPLMTALMVELGRIYLAIVRKRPASGTFLVGWMRRCFREP